MIMKIKDLTIEQILKIAKKYAWKCSKCPLIYVEHIECYNFCELKETEQKEIEESFEQEIEVDLDE